MPRPDPKLIEGARTLLFERLVDDDRAPRHPYAHRVLDKAALRESVRREISWLLNSRCAVSLQTIGETERTVVNYGLPDFSSLSPRNSHDQQLLAAILARTITAFEPRLQGVRVVIERFDNDANALLARIEATLVVGDIHEPVSFPIKTSIKTGKHECE